MAKLTIQDLDLKGKRVFVRVDFNVPIKDSKVTDDLRIREALPTIRYGMDKGAILVLASHLGRPKGKAKPEFSLAPVANRLSELLDWNVRFAADCVGSEVEKAVTLGQPAAYLQLVSSTADRAAASTFADNYLAGPVDRAVVRQRDQTPLENVPPGDGYRLTVEILFVAGNRGRLVTWQFDVRRQIDAPAPAAAAGSDWRIERQRQTSAVDRLYRLALDPQRQFAAHNLLITADDLRIAP